MLGGNNMASKFEIYTNPSGEFRWRPIYMNGRAIASLSEGYKAKINVMGGIHSVKENISK
jgi:uncharacterized protein YegP (UPF0339 family)